MDIKTALGDPLAAIASVWGDAERCPQPQRIVALAAEINALTPAIKQQKELKQLCAKQFGAAKAGGGDIAALKAQMQDISGALQQLEQQRKTREAELLELLQDNGETTPELPQRFLPAAGRDPAAIAATIIEIDATVAGEWDDYVDRQPQAALYHRYLWRDVIANAFGHSSHYFVARDAHGIICGVLPLVRLRSRLFGDFGVSLPFFNYGGPLADSPAVARQLLDQAAALARQLGLQHLEIRSVEPVTDWPARTDKLSMLLRLPGDVEELESGLGAKLRSQIKRAQQENATVLLGGSELLDDFYAVFAENMRDLGTPVYAKEFFATILRSWPQQSHIVALRLRGKPVAAAFLLGDRDLLEIPWASTLRSVNALNLNMQLYWEVLKLAIVRGYQFFDFGRSTQDSGTYRFKKQWGAQPLQHHWHYWLRDGGELPALKPDNPKFRLLIACWRRLPVFVTRLIGPPIVKNLP